MNLRPKILLLVIGVLLVSFLALSIPLYWYTRSALEAELDKRLVTAVDLAGLGLDTSLVMILLEEPALVQVRAEVEKDLARMLVHQIEGLALYSNAGVPLALASRSASDPSPSLLNTFTNPAPGATRRVSEIYQLPDGRYLKAAGASLTLGGRPSAVLVAWGGVEFMAVVDQLLGSLFWITLVSILVAVSLAVIFSQSLIRPVRQLSDYAQAIRKNIYSPPVDTGRRDELGTLNRSLREMHSEIVENEQRNKQLFSGIAHEIKNPLGGMEIYTGLLNEELDQHPRQRSYLDKISRELHHLKRIVLSYLDYARPVKSKLQRLEVESIVEEVHQLLAPEMNQKQVDYRLSGQGQILGDESKMRVVFINLLKNSLAAVDQRGQIRVRIENRDHFLEVSVQDDGRGIPREQLEEVFQPYYSTQDRGYGLGLAITRNIVAEMNGTIIAESEEGQGTIFRLTFPRE